MRNHAALTARLPCNSRFDIRWSRRGRREADKRRLHQRVGREVRQQVGAPAVRDRERSNRQHREPRRYGPRYPAKGSTLRRHWHDSFGFHHYLTHDALL